MRRLRGDQGQLLLLTLGYVWITASLTVVAVDVSTVFIARRNLVSVTDGAATAAAQVLDEPAYYADRAGPALPLDTAAVIDAVAAHLARHLSGVVVDAVAVGPDGQTVLVATHRVVRLPVVGILPVGSVTVRAEARARARLR